MTFEMLAIEYGFNRDELMELTIAAGCYDLLYKNIYDYSLDERVAFLLSLKNAKDENKCKKYQVGG